MERTILLTLEYDGSGFHGWQQQSELRSVQGTVREALSAVLGRETQVNGTSRTDAGVHALGQCCSFVTESAIPAANLPLALNNMLAGGRNAAGRRISDVRVLSAEEMQPGFHARFDCRGKTYRYVFSTGVPSVFRQKYCYFVDPKMCALPEGKLDLTAMDRAAALFTGTHDFAAFQSAGGTPRETTVRTVFGADVRQVGAPEPKGAGTGTAAGADVPAVPHAQPGDYVFTVTGDGFLYNMVRIMAGTLVEVGLGRRDPEEIPGILASADRRQAGHTAPPQGLYLAKIYFDALQGQDGFGKD